MTRYLALLRAVNIGGHFVKMEELRRIFRSLGLLGVETYIQSGNVFFTAAGNEKEEVLRRRIEKELQTALGYDVGAFLRSVKELKRMVEADPFGGRKTSAGLKLFVTFLGEKPKQAPPGPLPILSPKKDLEVVRIAGRDVFTLLRPLDKGNFTYPNPFLEKLLGIRATTRNWEMLQKMITSPGLCG